MVAAVRGKRQCKKRSPLNQIPSSKVSGKKRIDSFTTEDKAALRVPRRNFLVNLKSPPVDGKANDELIGVLAEKFNVPKSKIKSGLSSGQKLIEIDTESSALLR